MNTISPGLFFTELVNEIDIKELRNEARALKLIYKGIEEVRQTFGVGVPEGGRTNHGKSK